MGWISDDMRFQDAGHGFDIFGMSPSWVKRSSAIWSFLYKHWFRVRSHGIENIPRDGATILASNHSGTLPFDGVMIYLDVGHNTSPARVVRPVADHFVPGLPFVGTYFARVGVVGGSRDNVRCLLERGELLLVFPEGTPGISKRFSERYQLRKWREGHVELAIRHGASIVPVAVIGAEEQMPQLARIPIHLFGSPFLPLTAVPFPLPVRYHIYYGEPIPVHQQYSPEQADDPEVLRAAAADVQAAVQALIDKGLEEREGIFR